MLNGLKRSFVITVVFFLGQSSALSFSNYVTEFRSVYPLSVSATSLANCQVCHISSDPNTGSRVFNPFGKRVSDAGSRVNIVSRLRSEFVLGHDSDGQGDSNRNEINSGTQPGWNTSSPSAPNLALDPQDPIANANGPYDGVNLSVSFSSSGSNDPDPSGNTLSYLWTFGDGISSIQRNPTHTYSEFGNYTATLTVTDNIGDTDMDTVNFTLIAPGEADVLLVDDDDNTPNVRSYYTDALNALNITYEIWNTNNSDINEPDTLKLLQYQNKEIVWFTGDNYGGFAGPGAATEARLATYLENGGNLFISSQSYFFDRGITSFMQQYLGVSSLINDVFNTTVTGANQYEGQGAYPLFYFFSNFSDGVIPDETASLSFDGNGREAGIIKQTKQYRTSFWGFPLEAISTPENRAAALLRVLRTQPLADVLLVDDDDNSPNVLTRYTDALDTLGKTYSIWDTRNTDQEPSALALAQYKQIIWFSGGEYGGFSGPGTEGESALSEYLDQGGRLFITSQYYQYDHNVTPFMMNYLGVLSITGNAQQFANSISGKEALSGLGMLTLSPRPPPPMEITSAVDCLNAPGSHFGRSFYCNTCHGIFAPPPPRFCAPKPGFVFPRFPGNEFGDAISPANNARVVIESNVGVSGVSKKENGYQTIFWTFPFDAIPSAEGRAKAMKLVLENNNDSCFVVPITGGKAVVFCL